MKKLLLLIILFSQMAIAQVNKPVNGVVVINIKRPTIDSATGRRIIYSEDTSAHPETLTKPIQGYLTSGRYSKWVDTKGVTHGYKTDTFAVLIDGKYYHIYHVAPMERDTRFSNGRWITLDSRYFYNSTDDPYNDPTVIYYPYYASQWNPKEPYIKKEIFIFNGVVLKETDFPFPKDASPSDTLPPIIKY